MNKERKALFLEVAEEINKEHMLFLKNYIIEACNSENRKTLIAVASAIRKYVASSPPENLGWMNGVLLQGRCDIAIELEVAKMFNRKYTIHGIKIWNNEPVDCNFEIAKSLAEILALYLHPRLLYKKMYNATAMNAAQAIIVMCYTDQPTHPIIQAIDKSPVWFQEQLIRRLKKQLADWPEHIKEEISSLFP